jgi:hypothetical protein
MRHIYNIKWDKKYNTKKDPWLIPAIISVMAFSAVVGGIIGTAAALAGF